MYEVRPHHHEPTKRLLLVELTVSFVVAAVLVSGGWIAWAQVAQMRAPAQSAKQKEASAQAEQEETCIVVGGPSHGGQGEVCPD